MWRLIYIVSEALIPSLMVGRYFVLSWWHWVVGGPSSPYGRLTEIVVCDRVKWSWEVTCCHFILSLHSAGGGRGPWQAVVISCKTCSLQSMTRTIIFGWLMLVIRMYLWKPSGCFMLISVVWTSLRQSGYEGRVTCIRMGVIRMVMRATCHHEMRDMCSQEEGSLQCPSF